MNAILTPAEPSISFDPKAWQPSNLRGLRRGLALGLEVGASGFKLSLARYRKGFPEVVQRVRRSFSPPVCFDSADVAQLTDLFAEELPRLADLADVPTIAVLPPQVSIYAVQQATTQQQAIKIAAAEVYEGQVDTIQLNANAFSTYTCPGPFATLVADAIHRAGYRCSAVVSHPLVMRFAAHLMGASNAAVLDWGWQGCVLSCGSGTFGHFTRNLNGCGLDQVYQQAARAAGIPLEEGHWNHPIQASVDNSRQRRLSDALRNALAPTLHRIASHVQQTVRYGQRFGVPTAKALVICGGGSLQPQVCNVLQRMLDMPVHPWSFDKSGESQSSWAISTAAALLPLRLDAW